MKPTFTELQKATVRIEHYRTLFANVDYVYLASDSAIYWAGGILRDAAIGAAVLKNTPIIMVKPGFENLCRATKSDSRENLRHDVEINPESNRHHVMDNMIRRQLYGIYDTLHSKINLKSLSSHAFHIMLSADSEWNCEGQLCVQEAAQWSQVDEQKALQQAVFKKHQTDSQIVISQNINLLQSLRTLCQVEFKRRKSTNTLITLSFNEQGFLYDPFEVAEDEQNLQIRIARKKLNTLVDEKNIYIDDSALRHPQAAMLLNNIKPYLQQASKQMVVLVSKKEPLTLSETLIERAQETPSTVCFSWLREGVSKNDALTEALLTQNTDLPQDSTVALITDRVSRAERIQEQLASSGVFVEIYSINKHGFLSNRDKTKPSLLVTKSATLATAKNKYLVEQAVKEGKLEDVLALCAADKEAFKNGVITCLCHDCADILERLIQNADRIQSTIINWWILEFKQFQAPSYLMEKPRYYDLLILALSKCNFFSTQAQKWLDRIQSLEEAPTAAKVELGFLYSLFEHAIEHASVTGATRIRRTLIPKQPPKSVRKETDILRFKIREMEEKKQRLIKQIETLTNERFEMERQIAKLEAELEIKSSK